VATTTRPPAKRRHARDPDAPVPNRRVSSLPLVLDRAAEVMRAWQAADEPEARAALRSLASEAELLAGMRELPLPSPIARRHMIAAEREPSGRGGSG